MACAVEKTKKARASQPQVRLAEPDETLLRYHVDLFNPATGKAKDARFEEIDFTLYKPGAKSIAFSTSEERIKLWIRCFIERYYIHLNQNCKDYRVTWEEQDSATDPNVCDRIIIHLYASDNGKEHHIVAITVYVSTGTIFTQGRWFQSYGAVEFPLLLGVINQMSTSNTQDDLKDLCKTHIPNFLEKNQSILPDTTDPKEVELEETIDKEENTDNNTSVATPETAEFRKTIDAVLADVEPQSLKVTPSKLHTLTTLRSVVAKMESDQAEFKVELAKSLHEINTAMAESDSNTKDRLCQLDNTLKLRIKNLEEEITEVRSSETKMAAEITKLASTVKKLQDQLTSVQKQNESLLDKQEMMKVEMESLKVAHQQQTPSGQLLEETNAPQDANSNPFPAGDYVTSPLPLSNKFDILSVHLEDETKTTNNVDNQPPKHDTTRQERKIETTSRTAEKAHAVILCDSNGKYLDLKKLIPDRNTSYFRCHTITQGNEIIDSSQFDSPQLILLHVGTNDLEKTTPNQLISDVTELIKTTAEKYSTSKVLYSTLLPRRDIPNDEISKINHQIEHRCSHLPNVHLIDHTNLMQQNVLHDSKHLNQFGVKIFAKNLKTVIYGRRQTTRQRNRNIHETQGNNSRSPMAPPPQAARLRHDTVFQRPPVQPMNSMVPPMPPHEYVQPRPSYATVLQRPPPPLFDPSLQPTSPQRTTTAETQEQANQGGHLMNISIPKKMLPLIQFFNNLV